MCFDPCSKACFPPRATIETILRKLQQSGQLYHRQVKEVLPMVRLRRTPQLDAAERALRKRAQAAEAAIKRQMLKIIRL